MEIAIACKFLLHFDIPIFDYCTESDVRVCAYFISDICDFLTPHLSTNFSPLQKFIV